MESLQQCVVKVKIGNLKISDNFDPKILSAFKTWKDVEVEIPYFRTSEGGREKNSVDSQQVANSVSELSSWLIRNSEGFARKEALCKIAAHTINYILWSFPSEWEVGGQTFLFFGKLIAIGILTDEIADAKSTLLSPGVTAMSEDKALGIMKNLGRLFPQIDETFDLNFISGSIAKLKCPINRALMKYWLDWRETFAQLNWTEGLEIMMTNVTSVFSGALWLKRHQENPYYGSEEDYRYFRSNDSGFVGALKLVYSHDLGGKIPEDNPLIQGWLRCALDITAGFNDILGFSKDVRKGESGGCIMNAIGVMGISPNEAVEREAKHLRSVIQDYMGLRDEVLTCFKEACPLVDTCDKMLARGLAVFANSEWYEVSGKMEIMEL